MTRLLLDCDPGLDDAVALALAVASPELELTAVSTVAANAPIDVVTENAERIMGRLACRCPLFQGAAKGISGEARHSTQVWGGDGRLPLAAAARPAARIDPDDFAELADEADIVCAIGSLTNIAQLIQRGHRPRKLVLMGGAFGRGNATPHAELNIWVDPEAARIVFLSGIEMTVVPLDITRELVVPSALTATLAGGRTRAAQLVGELLPHAGTDAQPASIHDAAAIAFLLWPQLFSGLAGQVSVITGGAEDGRTLFRAAPQGPHHVLTQIEREGFFRHMQKRLCGETP